MNGRPITEDDLQAFVDRALEPSRRAEVADYLAGHPEVARRVEEYGKQRELLRSAFAPVAEEPVPPELNLARMIEARRQAGIGWMRTAAAVVLLCIGGVTGWSLHGAIRPSPSGIPALMQEAVYSYEVYAPDHERPIEMRGADRSKLLDWLSQRMSRPVSVPDLSSSGYRFMGGRLVATPHGPAVLFMYDDGRGTRLVMLSRPMTIDQNKPMQQHAQGRLAGFGWADDGVGYSLVGAVAPGVLHPIANEVRRQISRKA